MKNKKRFIVGSLITFGATLLLAVGIYLLKSFLNVGSGLKFNDLLFRNIIDGLTLSGLLGALAFCLSFLSREGAFDILAYSVKVFWYNTFRRNIRQTALPSSYAEYKELKHGETKESTIFILVGSLPCLVVGLILLIPYNLQ